MGTSGSPWCEEPFRQEIGFVAILQRGAGDYPEAVRLAALQAADREETEHIAGSRAGLRASGHAPPAGHSSARFADAVLGRRAGRENAAHGADVGEEMPEASPPHTEEALVAGHRLPCRTAGALERAREWSGRPGARILGTLPITCISRSAHSAQRRRRSLEEAARTMWPG